jgi:hypothetical protein
VEKELTAKFKKQEFVLFHIATMSHNQAFCFTWFTNFSQEVLLLILVTTLPWVFPPLGSQHSRKRKCAVFFQTDGFLKRGFLCFIIWVSSYPRLSLQRAGFAQKIANALVWAFSKRLNLLACNTGLKGFPILSSYKKELYVDSPIHLNGLYVDHFTFIFYHYPFAMIQNVTDGQRVRLA